MDLRFQNRRGQRGPRTVSPIRSPELTGVTLYVCNRGEQQPMPCTQPFTDHPKAFTGHSDTALNANEGEPVNLPEHHPGRP